MRNTTIVSLFALVAICVAFSSSVRAGEAGCCAHCNRQCGLKAVCRLVCEKKTVKETVYDCKCEDFCVPGHSAKCGTKCECDCNSLCGKKYTTIWQPRCGEVRHRTLLVKKEVSKEVPSYKCVVEYVCDSCCTSCCTGPHATHAPLSAVERGVTPPLPPPAVDQLSTEQPPTPKKSHATSSAGTGFSFTSLFRPLR